MVEIAKMRGGHHDPIHGHIRKARKLTGALPGLLDSEQTFPRLLGANITVRHLIAKLCQTDFRFFEIVIYRLSYPLTIYRVIQVERPITLIKCRHHCLQFRPNCHGMSQKAI